jgi:hypothetical protein
MDYDYENIFNNYNNDSYNLYRENSMEIENMIMNKHHTNQELNYELKNEDFLVIKSDTKSNTKNPSPYYEINSK